MSDITRLMRKHLVEFATYHGVDPSEELARSAGIRPQDVIRLNANENPYGTLPEIENSLAGLQLNLYPDPDQRKLRSRLADYTGQPVDRIVAGAGGDEIIDLLLRLFVEPGQRLLDCEPTFGMYSFCARVAAAEVVSLPRTADWSVDFEALESERNPETKIVFVASPNNPTGNLVSEAEARKLLDTGMVVGVDETYYEFSGVTLAPLLDEYDNLVILRSFSKWAGIAGLRVGYAIASSEMVRHLMDIKQPYNINVAAEAAAIAAIDSRDQGMGRVNTLIEQRGLLEAAIDDLRGVSYYPSHGNFLLCDFERRSAQEAYEGLARQGIFVRRFSHPRLTNSLRISVGTPEQTARLIDALRNVV